MSPTCPLCGAAKHPRQFACRDCWRGRLGDAERDAVYRATRARQLSRIDDDELAAVLAAVAADHKARTGG